ncbi:MAG: DUF342 domain-containing protein [Chlorobi bacterium]|nr:DUF342 domain-containing protein [Chlorobiota bacterium]
MILEVPTLSLMGTQTVSSLQIEGRLYFFSIEKLPVVNRIIPKDTIIISEKFGEPTDNKTEVQLSEISENFYKRGNCYYNYLEGFLIFENNSYRILPVIKDASFTVTISNDAMSVSCNFFPPAKGSKNLTIDRIKKELIKLKITANPDKKILRDVLLKLEQSGQPIYDVVIARGSEPKPGKNGRVDYLVDTENSSGPSLTENGRVDFYNLNKIHSVAQNQKLAIVHPPTQGKPGVDVFGKVIPCEAVKKIDNPKGANTYFDERAPNILLSKIDGFIAKIGGKLSVSGEYNVRGNVDFHTGNITSKAAVNINGDVKSGFKLDVDKSIIINGFVNDADIKSQGTISLSGGFGGSGKGKITAAGNVSLKFIRNQTIYSHADIIITKEAVDANLYAKGNIISPTGQTVIIGGTTVAGKDVEVKTLGNKSGIITKIVIGFDFEMIDKYNSLLLKIKELRKKINDKEFRIRQYSNIKNLTNSSKKKLTVIITEYKKMQDSLTELKKERDRMDSIIKAPSQSKVKVLGFAYPGVEILIKNTSYKVTEKIYKKTFKLSETDKKMVDLI